MRSKLLIIFAICATFFMSCEDENDNSSKMLGIELVPSWNVEGKVGSGNQALSVEVKLNVETISWTARIEFEGEDGEEWCSVTSESSNTGSGKINLSLLPNLDFENRVATLHISAGQFEKTACIDQEGRIFYAGEYYSVKSSNDVNEFETTIMSMSDWELIDSDWIHGEKGASSKDEVTGVISTILKLKCDANSMSAGRFGSISIKSSSEGGSLMNYYVYQFGTELIFDSELNMNIVGDKETSFDVIVPTSLFEIEELPSWIAYQISEVEGDGALYKYVFSIPTNATDVKVGRDGSIVLRDKDTNISFPFPLIKQGYTKAGGLVTADGVNEFIAAFNAKEDVSYWTSASGVVAMLNDIDFNDKTLVGSIGSEANPMNLVFDGEGYAIINLKTGNPLFGYVGENGKVENLKLGSSSSINLFSVTQKPASTGNYYLSPLVAINKGTVSNCVNNVNSEVGFDFTTAMALGGIVANNEDGIVMGCTNNGAMTVNKKAINTTNKTTGNFIRVGGVVASGAGGKIERCINNAAVSEYGVVHRAYVGGICGYSNISISDCSTTSRSLITINSNTNHHAYVGGIAGQLETGGTVNLSTNRGNISITLERNSDASLREYAGGVVGASSGKLTTCYNYGEIQSNSTLKNSLLGGIVGESISSVFTGNENHGAISANGAARYFFIGGLIGNAETTMDNPISGKNNGNITVTNLEGNTWSNFKVGGGIGQLKGKAKTVTNSGILSAADKTTSFWFRTLGGIVGDVVDEAIIEDCTNTALVELKNGAGSNNRPVLAGGILGRSVGAKASIINSTNKGIVNNDCANNFLGTWDNNNPDSAPNAVGGIIGGFADWDGSSSLAVRDCKNYAAVKAYRGIAGGIAGNISTKGSAIVATISNCENTGDMTDGNKSVGGGIAGRVLYSKIENCIVTTKIGARTSGGYTNTTGGIVGELQAGSTCVGSKYYGELMQSSSVDNKRIGGIAGTSVSGAVINNCGFGGTINALNISKLSEVCGDANFSSSVVNYIWSGVK